MPPRWTFAGLDGSSGPVAATVYTPDGARVVRSVAAIPGWTATWDPRHGTAVTLAIAVDGLV